MTSRYPTTLCHPNEMTAELRKQYELMRLSEDEASTIVSNATRPIIPKGDHAGNAPGTKKDE